MYVMVSITASARDIQFMPIGTAFFLRAENSMKLVKGIFTKTNSLEYEDVENFVITCCLLRFTRKVCVTTSRECQKAYSLSLV